VLEIDNILNMPRVKDAGEVQITSIFVRTLLMHGMSVLKNTQKDSTASDQTDQVCCVSLSLSVCVFLSLCVFLGLVF